MVMFDNQFDIRKFRDQLVQAKERGRYICPVCSGDNLTINTKTGAYSCWTGCGSKSIREALSATIVEKTKPIRSKSDRSWIYTNRQGNPLIKTRRIDDGNGKRKIWQEYWNGEQWISGSQASDNLKQSAKEAVTIYRYQEVREAIAKGEVIFWVEGEPCADALWKLGIPATTTIGGSSSYHKYGDYHKDLMGAQLVLVPDRDKAGIKYIEAVAENYPQAKWCYPFPDSPFWNNLPNDKGLDIADWIADYKLTAEEVKAAVGEKRILNLLESPSTSPAVQNLDSFTLRTQIQEYLNLVPSEFDLACKVFEWSEASRLSPKDIWSLVKAIQVETDREVNGEEESQQLKKLVGYQAKRLNLEEIYPLPLAQALLSKADSDRLDPIRLVQNLFVASATVLGARVSVTAKEGATAEDDWVEYPIIWAMDVSSPSSGKSNAQAAIFKPLQRLQNEENERYKTGKRELRKLEAAWNQKSPEEKKKQKDSINDPDVYREQILGNHRKWVFDIAEMEGVLKRLSEQERLAGSVWLKDELAGLFTGLDQYKSSKKGNARQTLLTAWNGPLQLYIDRVNEVDSYSLSYQTLNLFGGMQPQVAMKIFSNQDDPDGLVSRILPAVPEIPDNFATWNDVKVSIDEVISHLYEQLGSMQGRLHFSPEAKALWIRYWEKYGKGYIEYLVSNPAYAYFLGKMKSYLPRLSLILHCIEHVYERKKNFQSIEASTVQRAITLIDYYTGQFRLLQAQTSDNSALGGKLYRIWKLGRKRGSVTVREVQQSLRREKLKAAEILQCFTDIAEAGYGYVENKTLLATDRNVDQADQQPKSLQIQTLSIQVDRHVDQVLIADQQAKPLINQELQGNVDHVDQFSDFPDKSVSATEPLTSSFSEKTPCEPGLTFLENDQHDQHLLKMEPRTFNSQALSDVDHVINESDQQVINKLDQQQIDQVGNHTANVLSNKPDQRRIKLGDRCQYIGDRYPELKEQTLEVLGFNADRATCSKLDGGKTTWIPLAELKLIS